MPGHLKNEVISIRDKPMVIYDIVEDSMIPKKGSNIAAIAVLVIQTNVSREIWL
jgi:hypothetical protein